MGEDRVGRKVQGEGEERMGRRVRGEKWRWRREKRG